MAIPNQVKKYTSSITLHENDIPQDALQPIIAPLSPHPQPTQAEVQSSTIIKTPNLHTHALKNVTTLGFQPSTPPSRQPQSICTCLISDLKPAACMQAGMLQGGQNRQVQTTSTSKPRRCARELADKHRSLHSFRYRRRYLRNVDCGDKVMLEKKDKEKVSSFLS
ncbi:uncharacterized protein RAG0_09400 [Rhynchosporium agropyri]|uniref:Uncharacterized protein n=1 Tax=Rhynchosporium agropyri TaxID=914238 RepID=A0A1E1KVA5_9HELO|nr:uncharacterized protein RAG0_09400 [Rhynchosporium agropyri]